MGSSFGSTTEDIDGVPMDFDRGPPEENRLTAAELRGSMQDVHKAKLTMAEQSTVKGLAVEVAILKDLVDTMTEQHNRLLNNYMQLKAEFAQYKQQRAIELQSWLATGGSTTPEDMDGHHD
jgi:hypothetical protein